MAKHRRVGRLLETGDVVEISGSKCVILDLFHKHDVKRGAEGKITEVLFMSLEGHHSTKVFHKGKRGSWRYHQDEEVVVFNGNYMLD